MNTRPTPRADWLAARTALLAEEKALTRARDAIAERRRQMPRLRVEKDYRFHGPNGQETLADLFGPHSQLIVDHFMFGEDWAEGCPSCSFWADGFDGLDVHLAARDTGFVVVSAAPLDRLDAYKARMGWRFKWVSSHGTDFNRDMGVAFTPEEVAARQGNYNYRDAGFPATEAPGISTFEKDGDGTIWHSYSVFGRGLDALNPAYQLLDLTAKGRDEDALPHSMAWLRRRDQYESTA
ncbi:DUF899 domain-containing protein [Antarctobacter jejuensis]|uniref:DUF899 domain-containing protein n=1 Tax=Antarctobacter jejuensis TaxID=1439938 RepID=UPI003FCEEE2C